MTTTTTRLSIHRDEHGCFFVAYGYVAAEHRSPAAFRVSPFYAEESGAARFYEMKRAEWDAEDAATAR